MGKRRISPIDDVPLVGGAACLNFVNTTGARASGEPRERLLEYGDLLVFCSRAALMSKARLAELARTWEGKPVAARRALERAIAVREALYGIFTAVVNRATPGKADVVLFNSELIAANDRRALLVVKGVPRWEWADEPSDPAPMLGPILSSAAELLQSPALTMLRKCEACDWLFLDTTKNHTRRWCKELCGNRIKSHRYYQSRKVKKSRSGQHREKGHA